jgi:hypothetical protein
MKNRSIKKSLDQTQLWTSHQQVSAYAPDGMEIFVDKDIKELLEALWAQGYETIYSCSGGEPTNRPGKENPDSIGYIYFQTRDMAHRFMNAVEPSVPVAIHPYFLEFEGGLKDQIIRFETCMIPLFESVFVGVPAL